jgi:hypothetical protein
LKYIGSAVNSGKVAAQIILNILTKPPYNLAFGLYLLSDYSNRIGDFKDCSNHEKAIKECQTFEPFDLYRLCGLKLSVEDLQALQKCPKECQDFANAVKKKESYLQGV